MTVFEMLHTETTHEALERLRFVAKPLPDTIKNRGKKAVYPIDAGGGEDPVFVGDCFAVNEWMRTEMPIEDGLAYPDAERRWFYRVDFDGENWLVHYGTTIEAALKKDANCIASYTAKYRHLAAQFVRDYVAPARPVQEDKK
jgi:hypothetical protein